jgi:hypothetical protein
MVYQIASSLLITASFLFSLSVGTYYFNTNKGTYNMLSQPNLKGDS